MMGSREAAKGAKEDNEEGPMELHDCKLFKDSIPPGEDWKIVFDDVDGPQWFLHFRDEAGEPHNLPIQYCPACCLLLLPRETIKLRIGA